jgi:hypothetical protein
MYRVGGVSNENVLKVMELLGGMLESTAKRNAMLNLLTELSGFMSIFDLTQLTTNASCHSKTSFRVVKFLG